uniref:Ig-like domain-containing protein n=1 Tax=Oncorhynchus tshawytscha TaxID=74940 RepID=A0A8C8FEG3_ONCTS
MINYSLTPVVSASPPPSVVAQPGDNVTFHCTDVTGAPGHVGWFKQDNGSEPLCIASMYSSEPTVQHHNGFQPSHMEMFISHRNIFLQITEVDEADSGVYFCGMFDKYIIFTNATVLKVQGMYLIPLVVILGVVTAALPIVFLILVLKIRRDTKRHNTGRSPFHDNMGPIQDPDTLNYAALNFTSKKRKMERRREKELDPHVVYAATR